MTSCQSAKGTDQPQDIGVRGNLFSDLALSRKRVRISTRYRKALGERFWATWVPLQFVSMVFPLYFSALEAGLQFFVRTHTLKAPACTTQNGLRASVDNALEKLFDPWKLEKIESPVKIADKVVVGSICSYGSSSST